MPNDVSYRYSCFYCTLSFSKFYFFFFNHKTAYEWRISDWSSDVCSSDLDNIFEVTSSIGVGSLSDADNAKLASGVLDSLITVFRDDQLRGGRLDARQSLKFLDSQIEDREKALRDVEGRRAAFERSEERRGGEEWVSSCESRGAPE